jgi:hypothetical protein
MADINALLSETLRPSESVSVPTRVYFPSGTVPIDTAAITPDAAWENTASAVVRKLVTDGRKRGTAAASVTVTGTAANPEQMLHAQYVSRPMRAQLLAGNIRGQFRALESAAGANATIQIGIRVVSKDGQTVRATLLAVGGTTTTTTTPPEFTTSLTNRQLLTSGDVTPLPLSSYTCADGDRLVIEIGHNNKSTNTSQTHQISFGDNTVDLLTDDTTTTAQDPWVEFNSTIQFADDLERVSVDDRGHGVTQMMNQGWVKIADAIAATLVSGNDLARNLGDAEVLKLAESVTPAIQLAVTVAESLKVVDTVTAGNVNQASVAEALTISDATLQTINPEEANPSESLTIVDSVTGMIVLLAVVSEALKLDDIGQGATELIGVLHIQDTVQAALTAGSDLASSTSETLKLADTVTAARGLTASLSEALVVADSLLAVRDLTATPGESFKLSESHAETLVDLNASVSESLKISDTVSLGVFLAASLSEEIRIADSRTTLLNPLRASVSEALSLMDEGEGRTEITIGVAFRVQDGPVQATLTQAGIAAVVGESLRLSEGVTPFLPTLAATVTAENVKISDRVVILSAILAENLRLVDLNQGRTQLLGVLKIHDTVQAQLGSILSAGPSETIKISDPAGAIRSPLEPGLLEETVKLGVTLSESEYTRDEYLRITDTAQANITAPSDLSSAVTAEGLKLADTVTARRTLEVLVASESLTISDSVTASRGLVTTVTAEGLLLADSVTAIQDQIREIGVDSLKIAEEAPVGILDPEQAEPTDVLVVQDAVTAVVGNPDDLSTALNDERLLLADVVSVARDLSVDLEELCGIGEVVDAGYGEDLLVDGAEALSVVDTLGAEVELLAGADSDDLLISEELDATLAMVVVIPEEGIALVELVPQVGLDLATDTIDDPVELEPLDSVIFVVRAVQRSYLVRAENRTYRA